MNKFQAKAILESADFLIFQPSDNPSAFDIFGFYFKEPKTAMPALEFIIEKLDGKKGRIDFVISNKQGLNIFIKDSNEELITYALGVSCQENYINVIKDTASVNKRSALAILGIDKEIDSVILYTSSSDNGEAKLPLFSSFGCT